MEPEASDPMAAAIGRFATLVQGDPGAVPLDETALALSAVLQPELDVIGWLATLDDLAAACATPTRSGVLAHVCGELGFEGDRRRYGDWRNSCLDRVVAQRRGIPITLSAVVIEVARRVGVRLVGVGMPAHFLVGDPDDPDWFADPFNGGHELDRDGCRELLESLTHGQVPWRDTHLAPTPTRAVIARMLNNLKAAFTQQHDPVRLALVMRMRAAVPELAGEVGEAARAQAAFN
ncbi:MAG: transglutaminase-like domain-containing protein [Ilumatobacteraceae bacterium]